MVKLTRAQCLDIAETILRELDHVHVDAGAAFTIENLVAKQLGNDWTRLAEEFKEFIVEHLNDGMRGVTHAHPFFIACDAFVLLLHLHMTLRVWPETEPFERVSYILHFNEDMTLRIADMYDAQAKKVRELNASN